MYSNKGLFTRSPSQERQLFGERICDDLCEVILQYLSLEDKLRLECVSKQFRRTIFLSQRELIIDFDEESMQWLNKLEYLLERFPSIRKIRLVDSYRTGGYDSRYYIEAMDLIIQFCDHLIHFECFDGEINGTEESAEKFIKKFGSELVALDLTQCYKPENYLAHIEECNIEELYLHKYRFDNPSMSKIKLKKLKKFSLSLVSYLWMDESQESIFLRGLQNFAQNHSSVITHLKFELKYISAVYMVIDAFDIICRFTNLIHLDVINSEIEINSKELMPHIKQIALNNKNLESISARYLINLRNGSTNVELLSALKHFKRLKRLRLNSTNWDQRPDLLKQNMNLFSFEAFKDFKQLTHLTIDLLGLLFVNAINERVLKDIDIYLPNLQSLTLNFIIDATEWTADILSKLSTLHTIVLFLTDVSIAPQIKNKLRQSCKRIKQITLNSWSDLPTE